MRKLKLLLAATVLTGPLSALAQPVVTDVSAELAHGQTVTIQGSAFGTKSPAAPVLWDDGSSNTTIDSYYGDYQPTQATEGASYNMQYRDSAFLSGRGVGAPHGRVDYVRAGAPACSNVQPAEDCSYHSGSTVHLLIAMPSWPPQTGTPSFYVQYWYRLDPSFDEVCLAADVPSLCEAYTSGGENCKQFNIQDSETMVYPSSWGYAQICNSDCPDVNQTGNYKFSRLGSDCETGNSCSGANLVEHTANPINGWIQMIWIGDYDVANDNPIWEVWTFPDGNRTYQHYDGDPLSTFEITLGCGFPDDSEYESVAIGTFARVPRHGNGINSFRYFAGVYADDTRARVVLGDNASYASCTSVTPQIPSAWSDTSIDVQANLGALTGDTAYLFVFDSDNNHNEPGFVVQLNQTGGGGPGGAGPGGSGAAGGATGGTGATGTGGATGGAPPQAQDDSDGCDCRLGRNAPASRTGLAWLLGVAALALRRRRAHG